MYRLLDTTLDALINGVDRNLAARYFEFWVLRLSGLFPIPRQCPECGNQLAGQAVLPRGGETLVCRECGRGAQIEVTPSSETLDLLQRMHRSALRSLGAQPVSREALRQIRRICAIIRRSFLQRELNSYRVIEEMLGAAAAEGSI